jgi:hypothetical protein|tara:strand:- start:3321 stop:3740 length:420 start_codon:yes stop_codon:yes gene_type:complete
MSFTKVAPAGIGTEPGDGYRIGNSFLHATGLNVSGIVTATQGGTVTYYGDGSNLTGVVASDVPVGNSGSATIFYETDDATTISTTTTLSRASGNPGKIYTKFQEVVVGTAPGTVELIIADGEEFVVDAYQLAVNTKDVQ